MLRISTCLKFCSLGKDLLTLFQRSPGFYVCSTRLLKTVREKEKLLVTSNLSFPYSVFYSFGKLSAIFIKLKSIVCRPFQFRKSLKFVVLERVDNMQYINCLNLS